MHGFCHTEIPTTDPKRSSDFYEKVFSWKMDTGMGDYIQFTTPDNDGGGFTTESKPVGDGVIVYIKVEDINKKLSDIEAHGGHTVKPKTLISEEFGSYALFTDPCGNIMGLWSKT